MTVMKQYRATKSTTITEGRVRMDRPQAFRRAGHLRPVPGAPDEYEITNRIILVPGEAVWIDIDDPDAMGLEPVKPKRVQVKAGTVKRTTEKANAKK